MTWMSASLRAAAIFLYVVIFTVVLPDFVIGLDPIATASSVVRDAVVLAVWGAGFVGGIWVLRRYQDRGLI